MAVSYREKADRVVRHAHGFRERHGRLPSVETLSGMTLCGEEMAAEVLTVIRFHDAMLEESARLH